MTALADNAARSVSDARKQGKSKGAFVTGIHGLRAFAALAVVAYHSGAVIGLEKYQGLRHIADLTKGLDSGVDLFFVISGFVVSLPLFTGRRPKADYYLRNRLLRIYPIAILTSLVFMIPSFLFFHRVPGIDDILSSFVLLPSLVDPTPIVFWTLKQELLFYWMFLFALYGGRAGMILVIAWGISSPIIRADGPISGWLFHAQNVQFLFGMLAAWMFTKPARARPVLLSAASVSAVAFVFVAYWSKQIGLEDGLKAGFLGALGFFIVYGVAAANLTWARPIMFLGTASYSVYLIHFLFVSFGDKLVMWATPGMPGMIALLTLTAFATGMGCIYYLVVEKRLEKWRNSLNRRPVPLST